MKNIFNTIVNNRILKHCTYFFSFLFFCMGLIFYLDQLIGIYAGH